MYDAGQGGCSGGGTVYGHERVDASLVVVEAIEADYEYWDEECAIQIVRN